MRDLGYLTKSIGKTLNVPWVSREVHLRNVVVLSAKQASFRRNRSYLAGLSDSSFRIETLLADEFKKSEVFNFLRLKAKGLQGTEFLLMGRVYLDHLPIHLMSNISKESGHGWFVDYTNGIPWRAPKGYFEIFAHECDAI